MIRVKSSNLVAVAYGGLTLHIQFHSGRLYAFYNVPRHIFDGLMSAKSKGKFFHERIRERYAYQRIL